MASDQVCAWPSSWNTAGRVNIPLSEEFLFSFSSPLLLNQPLMTLCLLPSPHCKTQTKPVKKPAKKKSSANTAETPPWGLGRASISLAPAAPSASGGSFLCGLYTHTIHCIYQHWSCVTLAGLFIVIHLISDLSVKAYSYFIFEVLLCNPLQGFFLDFNPDPHEGPYIWWEHKLVLCGFSSLIELPNSCSASGIVSFPLGLCFV